MRAFNNQSFGDMQRIADTRWGMLSDEFANYDPNRLSRGGRNIGGPLPSKAWDAFFGAIQRKGQEVEDAGGTFNVDLVGRKGTSGIGSLKAQQMQGTSGVGLPQAISGLTRAVRGRK